MPKRFTVVDQPRKNHGTVAKTNKITGYTYKEAKRRGLKREAPTKNIPVA
jgi:hypothetical protein